MVLNSATLPDLELVRKRASNQNKIDELRAKKAGLEQGGGPLRLQKQHASGKLTARERLDILVDRGTFQEVGLFARHRATYFGMSGKRARG